jgi:hypothetical protein
MSMVENGLGISILPELQSEKKYRKFDIPVLY